MSELHFTVDENIQPGRLDLIVAELLPELSRSYAQKLIELDRVLLNGRTADKKSKCRGGDKIFIDLPEPESAEAYPQDIPVDIVYEDCDLLVVNKPRGMVVHPAPGNPDGTLVNALLYHCGGTLSGINGVIRPGIVHRIDKDTSGLLAVAKNDTAHEGLALQIAEHSFKREYRGVTVGAMPCDEGTIDLSLGRSRSDRKKQAVDGINPRRAVTHYSVLEHSKGFDFCRFVLETGRTHQIRVHCAALGHPLAGDTVYGNPKGNLGLTGQCLHAAVLGFIHPVTREYMEFSAPLPDYFEDFLTKIRKL